MTAPLSIVIPTLDAAEEIGPTLRPLTQAAGGSLVREIIVVDGGSGDATCDVAGSMGARVVTSPACRGGQLALGAEQASGAWILFLHADTVLDESWARVVEAFIEDAANRGRAAVFLFALDDPDPRARRIERFTRLRCRVLGLPYGDQGLLIHRELYRKLGGFRPYPLMEDVDLVRRIGRSRIHQFAAPATTSAARYSRDGWWLRPLRNLALLALFSLGAPPRLLARLY